MCAIFVVALRKEQKEAGFGHRMLVVVNADWRNPKGASLPLIVSTYCSAVTVQVIDLFIFIVILYHTR